MESSFNIEKRYEDVEGEGLVCVLGSFEKSVIELRV